MTDTGEGGGVALARSIARTSRPAGSVEERRARELCAEHLRARGFRVDDRPFEYSQAPGRWATVASGVVLAFIYFTAAATIGDDSASKSLTVGLAAAFTVAVALNGWWATRWGTRRHRSARSRGVNLVARRGIPNVWLVAHLDSKGQPVSLFLRAGGVMLIGVGWLVTLLGWLVYALGWTDVSSVLVSGLILAGIGALPLAACLVTDRGTGALDNASGIATIFDAVDRLAPNVSVGVLVTTAEELALAGARAWAAGRPPGIALNCDGVDDEGNIVCIIGRDPVGRLRRAIEQTEKRGGERAARVRTRRSLPGVLFDSVALAQAGWETLTVARGTVRSLARVHTARDTLAAWSGRGVAETAAFLAAVVDAIVAEQVGLDAGNHPARREE